MTKMCKTFRHLTYLLIGVIVPLLSKSQEDWRLTLNDDFFNKYLINGLKVGDTLPDLELEGLYEINNNPTGKVRLSDFKSKLVILDFWSTNCTSCIAAFPKMEQLQKKFRNQIQIVIVNITESEQEIKDRKPALKFPDLPRVVQRANYRPAKSMEEAMETNPLYRLLPYRAVPFHVWIGPDRVIKLKGGLLNTYEGKIEAFLDGEVISGVEGANTQPEYLQSLNAPPYYKLLGAFKETSMAAGSYFTRHNPYIKSDGGSSMTVVDSSSGTIRTTYINVRPGKFYIQGVFQLGFIASQSKKVIWAPSGYYLDISPDLDSLWFNEALEGTSIQTDTDFIKRSFCYEQILPIHISPQEARERRLEDFNRFFSTEIGMKAQSEKKIVPCYVLVQASNVNLSNSDESFSQNEISVKGKKMVEWKGCSIGLAISASIGKSNLNSILNNNRKTGKPWILLSETEWSHYNRKTTIILPHTDSLQTIEQLRSAIKPYGFDIIETSRELQFAVFSKVKN